MWLFEMKIAARVKHALFRQIGAVRQLTPILGPLACAVVAFIHTLEVQACVVPPPQPHFTKALAETDRIVLGRVVAIDRLTGKEQTLSDSPAVKHRRDRSRNDTHRYTFQTLEVLKGNVASTFTVDGHDPAIAKFGDVDSDFDGHREALGRNGNDSDCQFHAVFSTASTYLALLDSDLSYGFERIIRSDDRGLDMVRRTLHGEFRRSTAPLLKSRASVFGAKINTCSNQGNDVTFTDLRTGQEKHLLPQDRFQQCALNCLTIDRVLRCHPFQCSPGLSYIIWDTEDDALAFSWPIRGRGCDGLRITANGGIDFNDHNFHHEGQMLWSVLDIIEFLRRP